MVITYCEACGARMTLKTGAAPAICDACKTGLKRRRRPIRDSGAISRKKLDEARKAASARRGSK
jgi:hypothetical protein